MGTGIAIVASAVAGVNVKIVDVSEERYANQ
jgi:3-hydroxyacyl-CoA dehydrogenase